VRVLIHAAAARMGGARAHVVGLVPALAALAPDDEVLLIAQPDLIRELPPLPASWTVRAERAQTRGFAGRLVWEQRALPRIAERWRADVLLSFGSFLPLRSPCATVLEAGNALPFTHAFWHVLRHEPLRARVQEQARWALLKASLRSAERILTPTRAMRQDVVTRLPDLVARVDVALWGVAPIFFETRWSEPSNDVILGISKHGINKEFDVLVAALPHLRRRFRGARVLLTGTPNESRWSRRSAALAERLGIADRVCFAGDVPNVKMPQLMQGARVLVYPTWCESFGLPVAEALAMGAPVIAGDIPACREVGGDAARYYAPGDPVALAETLAELLASPEEAVSLATAAHERGTTFTWDDNAAAVHATLRAAAAGRG
jgi:glycosyltransferase involved in cell wall biosynthesis